MTQKLLYPSPLRPGDTVAIASPSSQPPPTPARFRRGVAFLRASGFEVRVPEGAARSEPRSPAQRAEELNALLIDSSVRAIIASIGGYNSNALLPMLDFDALRRDPKFLVGYSDITALHLGILSRAGVVSLHGPTLLPELAEFPAPQPVSEQELLRFFSGAWAGPLPHVPAWTDEFLQWDQDDVRPRTKTSGPEQRWLGAGSVSGPLIGGNLETLEALLGTAYFPNLNGAILFWETCNTSLGPIERSLDHLEQAGALDDLAGVVVGRTFRAPPELSAEIEKAMVRRHGGSGMPVVLNVDIGHTDPMLTLPIGHQASLDADARELVLAPRPGEELR
ncbi:S66 peptidase family protein [Micromonospora sp. NPDC049801]|uniref:S66 peptidase family protein n=1 Tax=unclassified Micromonospora TaxID=2617518 RepID=UPI0033FBA2E6